MDNSNPLKAPLDEFISKNNLEKKKIVFFGANKSSKEMCAYLRSLKIEPYAIIDNDKRKQHKVVAGLTTYLPEELLSDFQDDVMVLIASEYANEMTEQLERLGYKKEKHIWVILKINNFYNCSKEAFEEYALQAKRGEEVYKRVMASYPKAEKLFLCPYPGTGDIYLVGLYCDTFCRKNNINEYVMTVVGNGAKRVAGLFDIENIVVLSQAESDDLLHYVRVVGLEESNTLVCNDSYLQIMGKRLRGYKKITFSHMFQNGVFGLLDDEVLTPEQYFKSKEEMNQEAAQVLAVEKGINEKTIILSPYANTVTDLPVTFWEELAERLAEKGYHIFTNSCGDEEPVIKNTKGIFLTYAEMITTLQYAAGFIAVRSGLCDIIGHVPCKKVILYPEGRLFGACSTLDYFSLNEMKLCTDAIEFEYGDLEYNVLEDRIVDCFV